MVLKHDTPLPYVVQEVIDDVLPFFRSLDCGAWALAISGSLSKGTWDERSDIDFRYYHERPLPSVPRDSAFWKPYFDRLAQWEVQGVKIDGIWPRMISDVDTLVDTWMAGDGIPDEKVWTIWGYRPLPDLFRQTAIVDDFGIVAAWKDRMAVYPPVLQERTLEKHLASLRYWQTDYHYLNKVQRGDTVFLAGLSARLMHDLIEVLFALNERFFAGDGNNLAMVETFARKPDRFTERVNAILYPTPAAEIFVSQRDEIVSLIEDIEALVAKQV